MSAAALVLLSASLAAAGAIEPRGGDGRSDDSSSAPSPGPSRGPSPLPGFGSPSQGMGGSRGGAPIIRRRLDVPAPRWSTPPSRSDFERPRGPRSLPPAGAAPRPPIVRNPNYTPPPARWYGGHWWWRDPFYDRWLFWHSGYWWWPAPWGVTFVYYDDSYYPYRDGAVYSEPAPQSQAQPPAPAAPGASSYKSPDGRRTVQVYGPNSEAFLYDSTSDPPVFLQFLRGGVEKVRYSGEGRRLRIMLELKDGGFVIYDASGRPQD